LVGSAQSTVVNNFDQLVETIRDLFIKSIPGQELKIEIENTLAQIRDLVQGRAEQETSAKDDEYKELVELRKKKGRMNAKIKELDEAKIRYKKLRESQETIDKQSRKTLAAANAEAKLANKTKEELTTLNEMITSTYYLELEQWEKECKSKQEDITQKEEKITELEIANRGLNYELAQAKSQEPIPGKSGVAPEERKKELERDIKKCNEDVVAAEAEVKKTNKCVTAIKTLRDAGLTDDLPQNRSIEVQKNCDAAKENLRQLGAKLKVYEKELDELETRKGSIFSLSSSSELSQTTTGRSDALTYLTVPSPASSPVLCAKCGDPVIRAEISQLSMLG
jgi:chromosome segregation ATPase